MPDTQGNMPSRRDADRNLQDLKISTQKILGYIEGPDGLHARTARLEEWTKSHQKIHNNEDREEEWKERKREGRFLLWMRPIASGLIGAGIVIGMGLVAAFALGWLPVK